MKRLFDFSSRFRILKGGKISLVVSAMIGSATLSFAAPSGGVVTSGSASISQSGNITNIVQDSQKASINWKDFSINKDEIVNFKQPNVNSITLNRVIGNEKSVINGALNANGQVWILNSNGVLFGKNAKINTAGLLATTKELSDEDFQAGNYTFKGDSNQSVINLGEIDISDSGYATLLANSVSNEGVIKAIKGSVRLVGAKEVTINFNGNSLVDLTVKKGVLDSLVENKGAVYADGGEIYFTTNAVNELLKGVVNNEGIAEANSLDGITGHVEMFAHGGEAKISGEITAKDGFVETSGENINISSDTKIKAKDWLIDPTDIVIESSGENDLSGSSINATVIEESLNEGINVELQADNDITVNSNLFWDTQSKLTLQASSVNVNAEIKNTNTTNGGVYFDVSDSSFDVNFGQNGKVVINNVHQLQWMNTALNGNYELGSDIDASNTVDWNNGSGWNPIGNDENSFTGNFDGQGYKINNIYLNNGFNNYQGFFGYMTKGSIKNVVLNNMKIVTSGQYIGGVVGKIEVTENIDLLIEKIALHNLNIDIDNTQADDEANTYAGGVVGSIIGNDASNIALQSILLQDLKITQNGFGRYIAGVAGYTRHYDDGSPGYITLRKLAVRDAVIDAKKSEYVGGLVGRLRDNSKLDDRNLFIGKVDGGFRVGGLVGRLSGNSVLNFGYVQADVTGHTLEEDGEIGIIAGYTSSNDQTVTEIYAVGTAKHATEDSSVASRIGFIGISGSAGDIYEDIYYHSTNENLLFIGKWYENEMPSIKNVERLSKYQMQGSEAQKNMIGIANANRWDFEKNWLANESKYPIFKWEADEFDIYYKRPKEEKPEKNIDKVITTIANQEAIKVNVPVVNNKTPLNSGKNVDISFKLSENKSIFSKPIEGQATKRVTLSQAKQMQQDATGQNVEEVKVSLSRSSIIELVDGGVLLPTGVEQEFYITDEI